MQTIIHSYVHVNNFFHGKNAESSLFNAVNSAAAAIVVGGGK